MQQKNSFTTTINDVTITTTFTDLAENAGGSVFVEAGDTVVFVSATMSEHEASQDYFPLSVEFEERFYSVGAILGSRFVRREGRPSQEAVLNARIIDRTIRPLFPKALHNEVQVVAMVLSLGSYNPDVLAVMGASLALGTSSIPWNGPVSAVRFSQSTDGWQPFTNFEEAKDLPDHILLCGKEEKITMIEMEGKEVAEEQVAQVGEQAMHILADLQKFQQEVIAQIGRKKQEAPIVELSDAAKNIFDTAISSKIKQAMFSSEGSVEAVQEEWRKLLEEKEITDDKKVVDGYFEDMVDELVHTEAVENGRRADERGMDEVRPLYTQAGGISARLHGSGIFYRGGTHVFTALTLGSPGDALSLNTIEDPETDERFMHHYNFPPYSTGEVGRIGSPKRREIGHGALAEKALRNVLPSQDDFPYTMRLVSECFASNGSTSMGSVCASTLALMDGGVPILAPVAGIAIGLMQKGDKYVLLTDIQGPEDHHGAMDFKVAGTKNGITAIQMDVKIEGITLAILAEALERGRAARLHILEAITKELPESRASLSPHAPHIETLTIDPECIGMVIGTGGKTIKQLRTDTGVDSIDIEDDGTVSVSGSKDAVASAIEKIHAMTRSFEVGDTVDDAVIKNITDFGAFAELSPSKDGMIHVSEFSPQRIDTVASVVSPGDTVPVIVKEVRPDGRIALSVKDRDPSFFDAVLQNTDRSDTRSHNKHRHNDRGKGRKFFGGRNKKQRRQ
ncbi:MAG: polyribonucleotide nucleotidyltransferase [Candidatus Kaiserbacteria bacterium]|nr:polyribonucleotide nucleotidyltransferase [Candidatus Kaiserbacteria bacterium]